MNLYLFIIIAILVCEYLLNFVVGRLNVKSASGALPLEFTDVFDDNKYKKAQSYLKKNTNFGLFKNTVFFVLTVGFILLGGFNFVDSFARSFGRGPILTGLIFAGSIGFLLSLLDIPFSFHRTFVIEEKFGFNKTSLKTFLTDIVKSLVIGGVIGGIVFSFIIWFFSRIPETAWIFCWIGVVLFQLFLVFISPVLIMPLFYKFVPLEKGELRQSIESYADSQNFALRDIYKIDASRRSSKSNAFFTGFGRNRRIALFDTLIEKHTVRGLVSVLAHEIGHYKKKHILKQIAISVISTGLLFFILSFFMKNPGLFEAFKMDHLSVYASVFFFMLLYTPINMLFSIIGNIISRKHEYQADKFAVETYHDKEAFISALKKLSKDNLSNLTPHKLKVFLEYSHPPILQRIRFIRNI